MIFRLFLALLAAASLCAGAAHAETSKESAGRAEILWDVWGVPHIFAKTDEDLFYALGWASMHNHAQVMMRLYGQARGRAAEYWGETWVASDTQVRQLRIPQRAAKAVALQTPAFRRKLEAFAAGVNAYAKAHPEKLTAELAQVLPIATVDLLAHQQRSGVLPFALAAMAQTAAAFSQRGSNAWVLAPSRTKSGHAMMVVNPHIPWGEYVFGGLFRCFEVDLKSPSVNYYGVVQVGNPLTGGGFNDRLGFTGTVNTLDDADVYALTLADGGYKFDGQVRKFDETRETIRVRGKDGGFSEVPLTVRWSVHGPVMVEAKGQALAVRLAGLDQPFQMQQYWDMARARDFKTWRKAVGRMQIPKSNLLYADADGHIFYLAAGRIPARKSGDYAYWSGIVPGDTSATLWTKTLPIEALPQTADPPAGWIQNANDPPWSVTEPAQFAPEKFPPWMSPRSLSFRAQRSLKMIEAEKFDLESLAAAKFSTRSELADRLLDELVAAARAKGGERLKRAADVLSVWDRQAEAASRGAVLFFAWADEFLKKPAYAQPWSAERARMTPSGLADPGAAAALLDTVAADVEKRFGALDVKFGDVYRLRWQNGADLPANGASGKYGVFRVTEYQPDPDGKQRAFQGDSFMAVVEFGSPLKAQALLAYGNASDPTSPHDGDQLKLYAEKRLRPVWRTLPEIEANLEGREILR
jgi:acyl-homoserine-lactone acylase